MTEAYDPRQLGRVLHQAMEEVLGKAGLCSLLQADRGSGLEALDPSLSSDAMGNEFLEEGGRFSASKLSHILGTLEQQYGSAAGKGLALRVGRACFQYGLREFGECLGLTTTSFRLRPFPIKLNKFAGAVAGLFSSTGEEPVRIERGEGKLRWHMHHCPFCGERHSQEAGCLLPVGLAEEALYWLSGGKIFSVEEVACIARGDPACVVQVDETPLS